MVRISRNVAVFPPRYSFSLLLRVALAIAIAWGSIGTTHGASEPSGVAGLRSFLKGLTSLRVQFIQTEYDDRHSEVRTTHGSLDLQRPGRFRWEYQTPYRQTIVSDGQRVWFYDYDLSQITVKPYNNALANSPALLLGSDSPLEDNFQITAGDNRDGLAWGELQPKAKDSSFSKAQLGFSGNELKIMELLDGFGQITRLQFSATERNVTLPATLFHFAPPPGVDVMDSSR